MYSVVGIQVLAPVRCAQPRSSAGLEGGVMRKAVLRASLVVLTAVLCPQQVFSAWLAEDGDAA